MLTFKDLKKRVSILEATIQQLRFFSVLRYSVCLTKDNNKVAIVTGSSKGIGKAIATEFVRAGYSVVINSRDEEELKNAAADIAKTIIHNDSILYVPGDIS